MTIRSQKTKRYSLVAAATVFGLFCLKSDCGSKQEMQQQEVTETKPAISSSLNHNNKSLNIALEKSTPNPVKVGLVEELKKEFSYSSLDCKIVDAKTKPKKDECEEPESEVFKSDPNATELANAINEVSKILSSCKMGRLLREHAALVYSVANSTFPLDLKIEKTSKEGNIAELMDALAFFDSLNTESPLPSPKPEGSSKPAEELEAIVGRTLMGAYFIESIHMDNGLEFDPKCLFHVAEQLKVAHLIERNIFKYLLSNPSETDAVLNSVTKVRQENILLAAAYELFRDDADFKKMDSFFDSLSPQMQEKVALGFRENDVLPDRLQSTIRSTKSEKLKAALVEFNEERIRLRQESQELDKELNQTEESEADEQAEDNADIFTPPRG